MSDPQRDPAAARWLAIQLVRATGIRPAVWSSPTSTNATPVARTSWIASQRAAAGSR